MSIVKTIVEQFSKQMQRGLDVSSLQFRLTVGVATASLIGLGGLAVWTQLKMKQMLFSTHQENLELIAQQIPKEAQARAISLNQHDQWQSLIERWSTPNTWLWVMQTGRFPIVESLPSDAQSMANQMLALKDVSPVPTVFSLDGHYIMICSQPIAQSDAQVKVYVAKDITHDYSMLLTMTRNLGVGTALAIILLTGTSAVFIWRSLHPLRQTCNMVGANGVHRPEKARLNPSQVPGEVKQMALTWNQLLDQLSKTGEQQRQLTSGISHELRTPLSLVYGYLQSILRRGTNLTPQQQEALRIAASETEHTIRLLQDLLDVARAESGSVEFDLKPLVLNDVVAGIIAMLPGVEAHPVQLQSDGRVTAIADSHYLTQALNHLLHNAAQYSPSGEPIIIKLMQNHQWAFLQVSDCGCGIAPDQCDRIFEPFYRVDDSRAKTTGGVGLGLAITKSLIIGMGGEIAVKSTIGAGTTFTIRLPKNHPHGLA